MLVIQLSRHYSEQILARQREVMGKRAKLRKESEGKEREWKLFYFYLFYFLWWSQVMTEEMSFQMPLENCQGFSIPDGGGKFVPPARNSEWKRSGEWFCASLWWRHEASLTRRSQTSGGDVDCYKWVEVGGCWACGCSICKHQCLELDASCNGSQCREMKRGVTWALLGSLKTSRNAAFWIICKG